MIEVDGPSHDVTSGATGFEMQSFGVTLNSARAQMSREMKIELPVSSIASRTTDKGEEGNR